MSTNFLDEFINKGLADNELYQPFFYRLAKEEDGKALAQLLQSKPYIKVFDTIWSQLRELIKTKQPNITLTDSAYSAAIEQYTNGVDLKQFGVWVYYPWAEKIVHILDEQDFIDLRTSANRNKITTEEREVLATKKVGVIGLSVGQSVSLTLAMERGCGELRIADFDTLELNNLNRIRAGVNNLGLLKAYVVAREIAEIDPFFKVVCYTKGVNRENIEDFFTAGGKLDLVIDECDSVNVKILCRLKAKELQVPVLMEASDRGTVDVERFDLEPKRPIIHGWLEGLTLDMDFLNSLKTSEEKLPYMLPISGLETLSPRMKASMVEINQTITTWPQLASAVAMGGAITADTCRRIFLNQFTNSGRYFIDLEQLIPDERPEVPYVSIMPEEQPFSDEELLKLHKLASEGIEPDAKPDKGTLHKIIEASLLAPSAGNNQPWKWYYADGKLLLLHDRSRTVSFGDYKHIASNVAQGAAIENLRLKAAQFGLGISLKLYPVATDDRVTAIITFTKVMVPNELYRPDALVQQIGVRCTNRNLGRRMPLSLNVLGQLKESVLSVPGAKVFFATGDEELATLSEVMSGAERLRMLHPEGHLEFYEKELRWTDAQSRATGDGIDISTVDVTPSELVGLKLVKDRRVVSLLAKWRGGKALEKLGQKAISSASAIGLITMPEFKPESFINGGIAVQRLWLTAAELGIAMQPMLAAALHFARLNYGGGEGMPDFMKDEFAALYKKYLNVFPESSGKAEVFLFRLSIAREPSIKSYRLPIEKVLVIQ